MAGDRDRGAGVGDDPAPGSSASGSDSDRPAVLAPGAAGGARERIGVAWGRPITTSSPCAFWISLPVMRPQLRCTTAPERMRFLWVRDAGRHSHCIRIEPGGVIGSHEAGFGQFFLVIAGSGWVSGSDGIQRPLGVGRGAYIERGEVHAKGSDTGLTAIMVRDGPGRRAGRAGGPVTRPKRRRRDLAGRLTFHKLAGTYCGGFP